MTRRRSINVDGFHHGSQPIPAAARVGRVIMTGGVYGLDAATGTVPDDTTEQTQLMFGNLQRILKAGDSSLDDVIKMTFYVKSPEARQAINDAWVQAFPDALRRPARHTLQYDHLPANLVIQCEATVVLDIESR